MWVWSPVNLGVAPPKETVRRRILIFKVLFTPLKGSIGPLASPDQAHSMGVNLCCPSALLKDAKVIASPADGNLAVFTFFRVGFAEIEQVGGLGPGNA